MTKKKVYILIGAKGSGKTFIGTLFKSNFGIDFVRVEDWMLELRKGREIQNEAYIRDAFLNIEKGVRKALIGADSLVFESTGLTDYFKILLSNLRTDYNVITIKVQADLDVCLKRVHTRDQSLHINVSDEEIEHINTLVISMNLKTDYEINNVGKSTDELVIQINEIIKRVVSSDA